MNSSLELNWIRKYDKTLPIPPVVFIENYEYGGGYYHPENKEYFLHSKYYDFKNGLIVVNASYPECFSETIAHEWRHHWQWFNGRFEEPAVFNTELNYKKSIIKYFKNSYKEMDALCFSLKYGDKNDKVLEWEGRILNSK